ncbi:MAG: hypothetical protein VXY68_06815, partial [Candidatus Thermoplasmatota archaeon]|nr:hypothetical protein [Candidatus Thermoplasmatota archaeon]
MAELESRRPLYGAQDTTMGLAEVVKLQFCDAPGARLSELELNSSPSTFEHARPPWKATLPLFQTYNEIVMSSP